MKIPVSYNGSNYWIVQVDTTSDRALLVSQSNADDGAIRWAPLSPPSDYVVDNSQAWS